jgi:hypothetical protein
MESDGRRDWSKRAFCRSEFRNRQLILLTSANMSHLEDIPTPDNGYYVLVTGANRCVYPPHVIVHSIDPFVVALGLVSEPA